jgi:hypothetical protein
MKEAYRQKLVAELRAMSEDIRKQPGFFKDDKLKAAFVCVLTLQGAVQFKDEVELSLLLSDFCKDKAEIITLSN